MDKRLIEEVLRRPRWSVEKIEEACRGMVNASCDDPIDIRFEVWKNIALCDELYDGKSEEKIFEELIERALSGEFDRC
ncbi:MAG: hypothetical protein ABII21_03935 [bacterium]